MSRGHVVTQVKEGSIAEEMGVECGDVLLEVNQEPIRDAFDYHYQMNDEWVTVLLEKPDGERWELEIEKEANEDVGLGFASDLMDEYRSCRNRCVFCFIDQMPPGMRETLYFKDDDARLSYLKGNYVTLTNLSEEDVKRILLYKLMPINISIHTTNVELRNRMLNNRFAGESLAIVKRLYDAGIEMNSQIVLCKGYNDGDELVRTIRDVSRYLPHMKSLSVVPVGLTKYREGLADLQPFGKEEAGRVIRTLEECQEGCLKKWGTRFVYASDEWYLTAGLPIPGKERYEGFPQLENGVGMVRSFLDEFEEGLDESPGGTLTKDATLVTGTLFAPYLRECVKRLRKKYPNVKAEVRPIVNHFFGEGVTVAGLLTGRDVAEQLMEGRLGEVVLIPSNLLRSGEDVFLDDVTIKDLESTLQREVRVVKSDGISIIKELTNE